MARKAATFYTGAAGRQKADQERERAAARAEMRKNQTYMPFRFYVPVGETRQAIIVDEEPNFFRYEHALQNPRTKRWDTYTGCVMEFDNCPVCAATGKDPTYVMYLTVIDLTPFKTGDGKTVKYSRKLLAVKPAQQKKFQRMFEKAEAKGHSLRGALIEFTRDDDKSASIGNDIELIEYIDEDDLLTYTRSWKDKEGKKHTEECHEVYDYEQLFGEVDADQLRALVGGEPTPGSRKHESSALGRRGRKTDDDDEDEDDYESDAKTSRMKSKTKKRDEDEDDDDEDEEDEKPARRSAAKTKPATRRAKINEDEDEDEEEDEDEDEKPSRKRAVASKVKSRPTSRRAKVEDDEDEDEDEDEEEDEDEKPARKPRPGASAAKKPTPTRRGKAKVEDEDDDDAEEDDEDDAEVTNKRNPRRVSMRRNR
jgi:hypothetical protein